MENQQKPINFTRGVPPAEAFPTQQIQQCAETILEQQSSVILQYHPAYGYLPLREWLGAKYGISPENLLVSNGSLQIHAFLAECLTSPGEAVLVEKPSYDRAITAFRRRGLEVVGVPLEADGYDLITLKAIIQAKKPRLFYIIPDFQNPAGITTSRAKREVLVDLARQYGFYILEDNPYHDLRYKGEEIPTIHALDSENVLFTSSFSKVLSPGMRVGYMIAPKPIVDMVAKVAEDTYITPNMLSQGMVYDYCRRGWLEPGIERLKDLYRPRLETLVTGLKTHLPQARFSIPEGGFFLGVYFPPEVDFPSFMAKAKELNLKLSDSSGFFAKDEGDSFLRLPFCALTQDEIREAILRLKTILE